MKEHVNITKKLMESIFFNMYELFFFTIIYKQKYIYKSIVSILFL